MYTSLHTVPTYITFVFSSNINFNINFVWCQSRRKDVILFCRFGKLIWIKIPSDMTDLSEVKITSFVHFLFRYAGYKRRFETRWADYYSRTDCWLFFFLPMFRVNSEDVTHLEQSGVIHYTGSLIETYDFKLSIKNRGKLDVRVQFVLKKPNILLVKEEDKTSIFDILCFNRFVLLAITLCRWLNFVNSSIYKEQRIFGIHVGRCDKRFNTYI